MAELARLIGQTDPFGSQARPAARPPAPPAPEPYQPPAQDYAQDHAQGYAQDGYAAQDYQDSYEETPPPPGPPAWMRRANVQAQPAPLPEHQEYQPAAVHPLQRYATQQAAPEPEYHQQPQAYAEQNAQPDPSRYDDALYGQLESGAQDYQRDPSYPDDPYAYQSDYPEDELEDEPPKKQRGGLITVAAILALAVVGTGGAFAYKTYMGSPRSGEPPIIKADNTPTKIVPAPSDGSAKVPDRMVTGDGSEKIVPREEAPIDVNAKSGGPRVVFPPLNQNANPPPVASVSPSTVPPPVAGAAPSNGTLPNNEPRRIRTLAVKGDQNDAAAPQGAAAKQTAAPKSAPTASRNPPTSANASANQPLSLAPQADQPAAAPPTRMAATNPTQIAPSAAPADSGGGTVLVSIASQDSESAARDAFRVAQGKYASVLGARSPVIKRVEVDGKVKYRAMVGPYRTRQEAAQFCTELKTAGGQCFIP